MIRKLRDAKFNFSSSSDSLRCGFFTRWSFEGWVETTLAWVFRADKSWNFLKQETIGTQKGWRLCAKERRPSAKKLQKLETPILIISCTAPMRRKASTQLFHHCHQKRFYIRKCRLNLTPQGCVKAMDDLFHNVIVKWIIPEIINNAQQKKFHTRSLNTSIFN